ncbi:toll/interleukin-1 receptor domain-containing protein [Rhizobium sp. SSA_523]|uniref:toll/interleukin-1 receptor domain-containing protein n=1 Tax=Rhizobium sp. SSA_523 TaxID=2952477 RepID=UPI0020918D20|nr:toll/interleukin-1 receptor domain-containing protein [Rhizobium sp. SSA_523]MCO5730156.1 toll/interleukin-1 receptor domain-containing protein [Rhizobium sp. SSA_523]WKC25221.1 toll/interleukin-1 receptor domain-containing protein [Rhizobium sp. SSA_523]
MANAHHVRWLREGREAWNLRRSTRHFVPILQDANLKGTDLHGYNLRGAQMRNAILAEADLSHADLVGAQLYAADLRRADLTDAQLGGANLAFARLIGADLSGADLGDADFSSADLSRAKLTPSFPLRANFSQSITVLLDVRTTSHDLFVDLSFARGLDQDQLNAMLGDLMTGVPAGLERPSSWIELSSIRHRALQEDSVRDSSPPDEKFVFLSYARADKDLMENVARRILEAGITLWHDAHIFPGDTWREAINSNLQKAAAVLTLWTVNSTESLPVAEEASFGQKAKKLVHARMDDALLPYGFAETQYVDLRAWNNDANDPEFRKLLQALKDKLDPPSPDQIQKRLIDAAPVAAVLENGLVTAKDSPPNAAPPHPDSNDLEALLRAQEVLARKALNALHALDNNLGEGIRFDLSHFVEQVAARPSSWYILDNDISGLKEYLTGDDQPSWPGSTRSMIENLCRNHELLRPRLQPVQPSLSAPEAPLPPPVPDASKVTETVLEEIASKASGIFSGADAEEVLAEPAIRAGTYLAVEIDEARNPLSASDKAEEQRQVRLRKALIALAGFIGTTIASLATGISTNVLTSPEAAKTFLESLKRLFELIVNIFN